MTKLLKLHVLAVLVGFCVLSATAQARSTTIECAGENSLSKVSFSLVKTYDRSSGLKFTVSAAAQGEFDGVSGALSGSATIKADPTKVSPIRPYFDVTDPASGARASIHSIESLAKSADRMAVPGEILIAKVKTSDPNYKYLVIKAVGDESSQMTAIVYGSNGTDSISLSQSMVQLDCSKVIRD